MKATRTQTKGTQTAHDAQVLADFILFSQRSCILRLSSELSQDKISYPQFFLLAYLASEDCLSMSSIAKMMGHSTAASTGMVDKLQELGLTARTSAVSDRRKIMVRITKQGAELVERMRANIARDLADIMSKAPVDTEATIAPAASALSRSQRHLTLS